MAEVNPDGSTTVRHDAREATAAAVANSDEAAHRAVEGVMQRHFGEVDFVLHELVSAQVHLDVHRVPPSERHPYWTLFTTGMSDLPMHTPSDAPVPRYAELVVRLPPAWKMEHADWEDENWYWPIRSLKQLARLPHTFGTWLGEGHTIPNGEPPKPYAANTEFVCWLVHPLYELETDAIVTTESGKEIALYSIVPLYPQEMELKLKAGLDALFEKFDRHGVPPVVDPARRNVAKRKRFLGLF